MTESNPELKTLLKDIGQIIRTKLRDNSSMQGWGFSENNLFLGRPQKMKKTLIDPLLVIETLPGYSESQNSISTVEAKPSLQVTIWRGVATTPLLIYDITDKVLEIIKTVVNDHARIKDVIVIDKYVSDDDFDKTDLKKGVVKVHVLFWE